MVPVSPVVTIDGPGGAGKGTTGLLLAQARGWHFLESGAIYRLLALKAFRDKVAFDDTKKLERLANNLQVHFVVSGPAELKVISEGEDVSRDIRTPEIAKLSSQISVWPSVREALLARQRAFRMPPGLVADGRDMGTVVFPDAPVKIFMTASPEERAKRRYLQLLAQGIDVKLRPLFEELLERDRRDQERAIAPLKPAEDAVIVDTTALSIEAVLDRVQKIVDERGGLIP